MKNTKIVNTNLNNLFSFYLFSVFPNELCKDRSCWPCEHSILRVHNLKDGFKNWICREMKSLIKERNRERRRGREREREMGGGGGGVVIGLNGGFILATLLSSRRMQR